MTSSPSPRFHWLFWSGIGLGLGAAIYLLSPILSPFLLGAVLAYVCNPLVKRLTRWRLPRAAGAVLALTLIISVALVVPLLVFPLFRDQGARIVARLPELVGLFNLHLAPRLDQWFGVRLDLDLRVLQQWAADHWDLIGGLGQSLLNSLRIGGMALAGIMVNALLAPVVAFYLLLDWERLIAWLRDLVPARWSMTTDRLVSDVDRMLSAFFRGQLLVMAILAVYYALALGLAGIPSALSIGLLTGALIFIPYIGYVSGLLLALAVAALQFAGWPPIIAVAIIFGVGQVLESFVLTPYLVGEQIGLSPLAVIFALMAFGQLFGFFGVLIALPAAAVTAVGLRELHARYRDSAFYHAS